MRTDQPHSRRGAVVRRPLAAVGPKGVLAIPEPEGVTYYAPAVPTVTLDDVMRELQAIRLAVRPWYVRLWSWWRGQ